MDILELQAELLRMFGQAYEFHPAFWEEFRSCTEKSGAEREIVKQLVKRLQMMKELRIDKGLPWLEQLKHEENLYSLHLNAGHTNYRLLFTKTISGKYFLTLFYERSGKRNSSYAPHIPVALERMKNE